jgi:hypothetical protein
MAEHAQAGFEEALSSLDTRLFGHVRSQTGEEDRLSMLALHNACRRIYGEFSYLEIGSHLGGSLQVLIADDRCVRVVSIDSRPARQPDERGPVFEYPENSTQRMLAQLESVPGADLAKLQTIEATTAEISPGDLPARPQLCFIDGEHTVEAALRDARFCRAATREEGAIVFHDRRVVRGAIERFLEELDVVPHDGYPLLGSVYVVELGEVRLRPIGQELLAGWGEPRPFLTDHPARRFPPG